MRSTAKVKTKRNLVWRDVRVERTQDCDRKNHVEIDFHPLIKKQLPEIHSTAVPGARHG